MSKLSAVYVAPFVQQTVRMLADLNFTTILAACFDGYCDTGDCIDIGVLSKSKDALGE